MIIKTNGTFKVDGQVLGNWRNVPVVLRIGKSLTGGLLDYLLGNVAARGRVMAVLTQLLKCDGYRGRTWWVLRTQDPETHGVPTSNHHVWMWVLSSCNWVLLNGETKGFGVFNCFFEKTVPLFLDTSRCKFRELAGCSKQDELWVCFLAPRKDVSCCWLGVLNILPFGSIWGPRNLHLLPSESMGKPLKSLVLNIYCIIIYYIYIYIIYIYSCLAIAFTWFLARCLGPFGTPFLGLCHATRQRSSQKLPVPLWFSRWSGVV